MTRRAASRFLLCAGSLVLGLTGAEGISRLVRPDSPSMRFEQDITELRELDLKQLASVLEPDPELFWRLAPARTLPARGGPFFGVISNRQGLREDHEIGARELKEIRILFLGDSCTFGYGLSYRDSFVHQTEVLLRNAFPGNRVECINAGVPGYTLFQGWRYLVTRGPALRPDLVVACFGVNDAARWDNLSDLAHYEAMVAARPPRGLGWSRLCQLLWGFGHRAPTPSNDPPRSRLLPEEFRSLLGKLSETARQQNTKLLLLVWPLSLNVDPNMARNIRAPLQLEQYRYAMEARASALDLIPLFQTLALTQDVRSLFLDKMHATAEANLEVSVALTEAITPLLRGGE